MEAHKMATLGIKAATEKIISDILSYESDTFSADGAKVTRTEASAMAAKLIADNIELGMNVDGLELTEVLEAVRS
jgi:hypothetical protein